MLRHTVFAALAAALVLTPPLGAGADTAVACQRIQNPKKIKMRLGSCKPNREVAIELAPGPQSLDGFHLYDESFELVHGLDMVAASLPLPPGEYAVDARATILYHVDGEETLVFCGIRSSGATEFAELSSHYFYAGSGKPSHWIERQLTPRAYVELGPGESLELVCRSNPHGPAGSPYLRNAALLVREVTGAP